MSEVVNSLNFFGHDIKPEAVEANILFYEYKYHTNQLDNICINLL